MQDSQEKAEEKDPIGQLCALLKEVGATLTLYGKPVSETELRQFADTSAKNRIINAFAIEPNLNRNVAKEKELFLAAMEGRTA